MLQGVHISLSNLSECKFYFLWKINLSLSAYICCLRNKMFNGINHLYIYKAIRCLHKDTFAFAKKKTQQLTDNVHTLLRSNIRKK